MSRKAKPGQTQYTGIAAQSVFQVCAKIPASNCQRDLWYPGLVLITKAEQDQRTFQSFIQPSFQNQIMNGLTQTGV